MSARFSIRRRARKGGSRRMNTTRFIALAFAAIILIGTGLLLLPAASRTGSSCGVETALFTATSATCVTGLVLGDTWSMWSGFGQGVILCLIEIGGLGFMSAASLLIFAFRQKISLRQRMLIAQSLNVDDLGGIVRLQRWVLGGSLLIEGAGALILFLRFLPEHGFSRALRWGVFHSVSAFCNAGFDIMGCVNPGGSVSGYGTDPVVCFTLMALIVLGGLGFFVWEELVRVHSFRRFSVYTKLVLIASGALILGGAVCFWLLEWDNPGTLGGMTVSEKLLAGLFQSVSTRTAGFGGVDQAALTEPGKAVTVLLMLVGGSSGSTAGGIKTVTLVTLLLFLRDRARGRSAVTVFHRTIPNAKVLDALTISALVIGLSMLGGIFISAVSPMGFLDALYEASSAIATVGLSAGGTAALPLAARLMIMVFMYFGRVGVLTISLGFLMGSEAEERFQYARTNLLIG